MNYRTVKAWVRKGADEHWPADVFVTIARDWEELLWTTSADHYRLRQVLMQFDLKGRHVLDVGCGTGLLLCFALEQGAALGIGVDIDPPRLHKVGLRAELKGNGDCCVLQVDIRTTLPFQRSFFDFAIFSNVIEHLRSSDQKLYAGASPCN
ncbi:MAG: class I SAM-dependent methyltransferase [Nitrososphaerales archaeon]